MRRPGGNDDGAATRRALAGAVAIHIALLVGLVFAPVPRQSATDPALGLPSVEEDEATSFEITTVAGARDDQAEAAEPAAAVASLDRERLAPSNAANAANAESAPVGPATSASSSSSSETPEPPGSAAAGPASSATTSPIATAAPSLGLALGGTNPFLASGALAEAPAGSASARPTGDGPSSRPAEAGGGPSSRPAEAGGGPLTARPPAPTPAEAKEATEAALRKPARDRERELGLGPEGPVLAALGEAAYGTAAPVKGKATFLAIADGAGNVVSIDVVGSDGATAAWREAARSALGALRGKKLRMPGGAKRAEMRIEVVSELKMPSGADPGTNVDLFHIPLKKGDSKKSTTISVLDPIPKIRADVVEVAPGVKVPIVTVTVDALAIAGDPADIGAKPRRVVHTKLVDAKVL